MHKTLHHPDGSTRQIHLGGWKKQHTDHRDETYRLKLHGAFLKIASSADNRSICSPVEDQGELGSCTAHMFSGLVEANENKRLQSLAKAVVSPSDPSLPTVTAGTPSVQADGSLIFTTTIYPPANPNPTPVPVPTPNSDPPAPKTLVRASRLFQYYGTRQLEGTVSEDSGATIRDAVKNGNVNGVADESLWGYDVSKFTQRPPQSVWDAAATHKVTSYHAIDDGDLDTMKSVLATGFLVGFGFQVYEYMMSAAMASSGVLRMPQASESLQGGHAVCLAGYDDAKGMFLVRNSWGTGWGQAGYFYMPYDYVKDTNLASDFWVVVSAPI